MNVLSKSKVFAENKLFATLDTTVRKVVLGNLPLLLTDTVGFIRKLPQQLMESFKSTLDEVREADLLIHVLDIAHLNFEDHYRVVNETLAEIDKSEKPTIVVFNKIDAYLPPEDELEDPDGLSSIDALKKSWMSKLGSEKVIFISAQKKENMDELRDILYKQVKDIFKVRYPYNNFLY
jgi:GTP-binding protein HflX